MLFSVDSCFVATVFRATESRSPFLRENKKKFQTERADILCSSPGAGGGDDYLFVDAKVPSHTCHQSGRYIYKKANIALPSGNLSFSG